jgi:hypothetical protein
MDAFFKGFAEGFVAVPQLIGSSVGLVPPPAIFTQMKTDQKKRTTRKTGVMT